MYVYMYVFICTYVRDVDVYTFNKVLIAFSIIKP